MAKVPDKKRVLFEDGEASAPCQRLEDPCKLHATFFEEAMFELELSVNDDLVTKFSSLSLSQSYQARFFSAFDRARLMQLVLQQRHQRLERQAARYQSLAADLQECLSFDSIRCPPFQHVCA